MTRDEAEAVFVLIENGWKGDMSQDKRDTYLLFLADFPAEDVMAGLKKIAGEGLPWMPTVPEVIAATRAVSEMPVPSWPEAWNAIIKALERPKDEGLEFLDGLHPILGAFVRLVGFRWLQLQPFYDPDHGALRVRDLSARWAEFVDTAQERVARGLALTGGGARRGVGPHRLDASALLGAVALDVKQLPEGAA